MANPVITGAGYILVHSPNILKQCGSTQTTTRAQDPENEYLKKLDDHLRSFDECVAYAPNQCYIGNILPDDLDSIAKPMYAKENLMESKRSGEMGEIMPEDEFYALMKHSDVFDLLKLTAEFIEAVTPKVAAHPILSTMNMDLGAGTDLAEIEGFISEHAEPMYMDGKLVGCVKQAHDTDENLSAHIMMENLIVKASGIISLMNLKVKNNLDMADVEYIIECSEEACGDINQRGGGNFAKAIGEACGCINASGSDLRSFCAAPTHAMINAAALVKAGIYKNVVVVAGGADTKLGMNGKNHIEKDMPVLEDTLGGFAVMVSENNGVDPVIVTEMCGRHKIGTGSAPQAVMTALIKEPLDRNGLTLSDIDKYSVEMQNPEITAPAGAGNVPEANYKMIGALAVMSKAIERKELMTFVKKHGMPGFAVTQGHIPSGVPFIGHAKKMMAGEQIKRAMIVGKGSLFLGRMTNQFDGVSFIMEKNTGVVESASSFDEAKVKTMIAESMRTVAENLLSADK